MVEHSSRTARNYLSILSLKKQIIKQLNGPLSSKKRTSNSKRYVKIVFLGNSSEYCQDFLPLFLLSLSRAPLSVVFIIGSVLWAINSFSLRPDIDIKVISLLNPCYCMLWKILYPRLFKCIANIVVYNIGSVKHKCNFL